MNVLFPEDEFKNVIKYTFILFDKTMVNKNKLVGLKIDDDTEYLCCYVVDLKRTAPYFKNNETHEEYDIRMSSAPLVMYSDLSEQVIDKIINSISTN